MTTLAYHFVADTLRDGTPIPVDGVWLEHSGPIRLCSSGLHWSLHPFDALQYVPGNTLCLVEYGGEVVNGDDKGVSSRRRIVKRIDAESLMREFARWSALQVIELWDAPDVVRQYLTNGDETLRAAARAAAGAAARAAATVAARAAARAAAWAAARAAAWADARAAAWAAAWADARAAAWAAARAAAWADARDAAWADARDAQRERFAKMVNEAFGSEGVEDGR